VLEVWTSGVLWYVFLRLILELTMLMLLSASGDERIRF
jgi:hypothetical protein